MNAERYPSMQCARATAPCPMQKQRRRRRPTVSVAWSTILFTPCSSHQGSSPCGLRRHKTLSRRRCLWTLVRLASKSAFEPASWHAAVGVKPPDLFPQHPFLPCRHFRRCLWYLWWSSSLHFYSCASWTSEHEVTGQASRTMLQGRRQNSRQRATFRRKRCRRRPNSSSLIPCQRALSLSRNAGARPEARTRLPVHSRFESWRRMT